MDNFACDVFPPQLFLPGTIIIILSIVKQKYLHSVSNAA
jgi:hypothetical protein